MATSDSVTLPQPAGTPGSTYHAGRYGHGVAQQGLEGLGAQEGLADLEGLSLQGCLQLRSGQGVLGVPGDLQLRIGIGGHMGQGSLGQWVQKALKCTGLYS